MVILLPAIETKKFTLAKVTVLGVQLHSGLQWSEENGRYLLFHFLQTSAVAGLLGRLGEKG